MKTKVILVAPKVIWTILILIKVMGILSCWLVISWWQEIPNPPPAHRIVGLLLFMSIASAFFALFFLPVFISQSCMVVKKAIERAFHNDFTEVRMFLSRYWLPVPKCKEIVRILRQLCVDRKRMPKDVSPEFADCIVLDEWGNYVLSWDGKEKMISKVNSGWFTAKKAEDLSSPKTLNVLMYLVVIVAVIRGIALIFQLFSRH
jgi:hypothetical protein